MQLRIRFVVPGGEAVLIIKYRDYSERGQADQPSVLDNAGLRAAAVQDMDTFLA